MLQQQLAYYFSKNLSFAKTHITSYRLKLLLVLKFKQFGLKIRLLPRTRSANDGPSAVDILPS